jgi:predicted RNA binding protein YcfA (HicA-like mRNA interferase family)
MSRMPQIRSQDLARFLKSQGFVEDRQRGSHLVLAHDKRGVTVTVPIHGSADLGRGLAVRILKDAGFSVDDFLRLR